VLTFVNVVQHLRDFVRFEMRRWHFSCRRRILDEIEKQP
jgi:hypothetical protein